MTWFVVVVCIVVWLLSVVWLIKIGREYQQTVNFANELHKIHSDFANLKTNLRRTMSKIKELEEKK